MSSKKPLPVELLRWNCDPAIVSELLASDELGPLQAHGIIGQRRALEAISLGLDIQSPGYNIFVTGLVGSGRSYTIRTILKETASRLSEPLDRCYVHNFTAPTNPRLIELPRGQAKKFRHAMAELVKDARSAIATMFEDDQQRKARDRIADRYRDRERSLFGEFEKKLTENGLAPVTIQKGPLTIPAIFPLVDGKPVPFDEAEEDPELQKKISRDEVQRLREVAAGFRDELDSLIKEARQFARAMISEVRSLERTAATRVLDTLFAELREQFPNNDKLAAHLTDVREHMLDHLALFQKTDELGGSGDDDDDDDDADGEGTATRELLREFDGINPFRVYDVNILLDTSADEAAPIVLEQNPTYVNVFGTVEREISRNGGTFTDFMHVRAGSLLRADGGYLVMNCRDVLQEPGVWRTLVRTLKFGELEIQAPDVAMFLIPSALKPEAVPVKVKVILIGDEFYYWLLDYYDEEFYKVFKIKAEFDSSIPRTDLHLIEFISAVNKIVERENLTEMAPDGHAALIEEAVRMEGRRNRICTRFGDIADVVRESHYWAKNQHKPQIDRESVIRAQAARRDRHGLLDERIHDLQMENMLLVSTDGARVGQINGLTVFGIGPFPFGKPVRITAAIGAGRGGVINIEREAQLSGSSHHKGVLILAGYFRQTYGQARPLAITASLAFEQTYGGVDGDSATCAEVYALMSAITGVPIRQDIAITGSMNQFGDVQAIGGVNEKIEGFFKLCKERGLTGNQGCIIPIGNVEDLMLADDVLDAARNGKFHLWAIAHIDDGVAILTGIPAGQRDPQTHAFPSDTMHGKVQARLDEMAVASERTLDVLQISNTPLPTTAPPKPPTDPPPPGPSVE